MNWMAPWITGILCGGFIAICTVVVLAILSTFDWNELWMFEVKLFWDFQYGSRRSDHVLGALNRYVLMLDRWIIDSHDVSNIADAFVLSVRSWSWSILWQCLHYLVRSQSRGCCVVRGFVWWWVVEELIGGNIDMFSTLSTNRGKAMIWYVCLYRMGDALGTSATWNFLEVFYK